jgi:hypothetical protein
MLKSESRNFTPWRKEATSRRRYRRWSVAIRAVLHLGGGQHECMVRDLSPGGGLVEVEGAAGFMPGSALILELTGFGRIEAEVRHNHDGALGLMFVHGDVEEEALALYLVTLRPERRPAREPVTATAILRAGGVETACVVADMSRGGARVLIDDVRRLVEGDEVMLSVSGQQEVAAVIRRLDAGEVGLMFLESFTGALESLSPKSD